MYESYVPTLSEHSLQLYSCRNLVYEYSQRH